jgi:hypothetical protein
VIPASGIQTISVFADEHPPMKELPVDLPPDLIPPPDKHHSDHEIPGYLSPFVPGRCGWYTTGEFLLMRPRDSNFDYALRNTTTGLGTVGPIESLKYNLSAGLRAELGYRYGDGRWETAFAYTYFNGSGNGALFTNPGEVLLPTITRPGLTDQALTAAAHANLDYQLFDMIVARRTAIDDNFAIRWLGGFRFADIRQNFNVNFDGLDARAAAVNTRSRFQGFSPIVGAEAVLVGWKGFHLYSRATAGLLSGRDTNRLIETNDTGASTYVNTSNNIWKVVPMGSIAFGGGWQYRNFSIRAGYEITYWQGIFNRPRFTNDVAQGALINNSSNLTLEGLFIQVGLTY